MSGILRVLYRGPLSSCNWDCGYCPFGKVQIRQDELDADFAALRCFVERLRKLDRPLAVFFTPWGEALIHRAYQRAIQALSRLDHVQRIVAQTNVSWGQGWLTEVDVDKLALWVTWHPQFMVLDRLLERCSRLREAGVAHSVGIVGQREHFDAIVAARLALPEDTYVWVNANKRLEPGYSPEELDFLERVDPLFRHNLTPKTSLGRPCDAGESAIVVDGDGVVSRCHFIDTPIGHLDSLDDALEPRDCCNAECRCHIGYVHLPSAGLQQIFGEGLLERIPAADWPGWRVSRDSSLH